MSFANPIGLWGLLSIPVILTLHLLRERRQRYVISSARLWSFMEEEVRGSLPSRLPLSWILLLDLLVAITLSLAWARPHMPITIPVHDARQVVILLDVSTSMRTHEAVTSRFMQAQQAALILLGSMRSNDIATVITFGNAAHWVGDTRQMELSELIQRVSALQAGENGNALEEALASADAVIDKRLPAEIHIFTDTAFPAPTQKIPGMYVQWHQFGNHSENQAVLELTAAQINPTRVQVFTRIGNFGKKPVRRLVTLLVDGVPIDSATLDLQPTTSITQLWDLNTHPTLLTVQMAGGDDLSADDQASLVLDYDGPLQVALVADDHEPLQRALEAVPNTNVRVLSIKEYSLGMSFNLVVFRGMLPKEWPTGNVLVVDPPQGNRLLDVLGKTQVQVMPTPGEDVLTGTVDFSGVQWGDAWQIKDVPRYLTSILQAGELPLILRGSIGASHIFVLLPDLETGNWVHHPSFPILIANILQASKSGDWPDAVKLGQTINLPAASKYARIKITPPQGSPVEWQNRIPSRWDGTHEPGVYHVQTVDMDGKNGESWIGVNAGDEFESNIRPQDWSAEASQSDQAVSAEKQQEIDTTPWFLGLATIFLLFEAILAWR